MVTIRKPYAKHERVQLDFIDPDTGEHCVGRTKQAHKDECDINIVLKNYDKTGLITHVNNAIAEYGDYTEVNEFQESLNMVIKAQDTFDQLPSAVRKQFGNDPGAFFEFATNPKNQQQLVEMGLAHPVEKTETIEPLEAASGASEEA